MGKAARKAETIQLVSFHGISFTSLDLFTSEKRGTFSCQPCVQYKFIPMAMLLSFRTRKGKKLRATDAAQGLFFLLPYPISGCGNLNSTLIGDMHKTIAITVQQSTRTHT